MAKQLLNVCKVPPIAMRDGYAGENAHLILPFETLSNGFWFASGQQFTFPGATVPQYQGRLLNGTTKPDTFQKDCCSCVGSN